MYNCNIYIEEGFNKNNTNYIFINPPNRIKVIVTYNLEEKRIIKITPFHSNDNVYSNYKKINIIDFLILIPFEIETLIDEFEHEIKTGPEYDGYISKVILTNTLKFIKMEILGVV